MNACSLKPNTLEPQSVPTSGSATPAGICGLDKLSICPSIGVLWLWALTCVHLQPHQQGGVGAEAVATRMCQAPHSNPPRPIAVGRRCAGDTAGSARLA